MLWGKNMLWGKIMLWGTGTTPSWWWKPLPLVLPQLAADLQAAALLAR